MMKAGGIILYPTDTVWGLGCDATNAEAVERIYKLKRSENKKSMLVLCASADMVVRYVNKAPGIAFEVMELATSPLTAILPGVGCWARNSRHCISAMGWELTSVRSFQSSSGRQTKLCEMRSLYSPMICVPLCRSNSLLCNRLPAMVFSIANIPMVLLSFFTAANTSSKVAQQINSISSPSKYLCAAMS